MTCVIFESICMIRIATVYPLCSIDCMVCYAVGNVVCEMMTLISSSASSVALISPT